MPATPESEKANEIELYEQDIAALVAKGEDNLNEGQKEYIKDLRTKVELLKNERK